MANMVAELYDALRDAGASEDKARAAATAIADYDARLGKIEADLNLLKWMVGMNVAMTLAILVRLFVA